MTGVAGRIEVVEEAGIVRVTLCNPDRRNAISAPMWQALRDFGAAAAGRSDLRAVLLSGAGGEVFSAGADISGFEAGRNSPEQARDYDDLVEESCRALEALDIPCIAVLRGPCVGAGVSLAACCDLRLAAQDAYLMVPAARLGLGYDPRGVDRFLRVFGASATRMLLLTAAPLAAPQALAMGALHACHPPAEVESAARDLVQRIAGLAPLSLRAAKASIAAHERRDASALVRAEALAAAADSSLDYAEGLAAFAAKRPPVFRGV